MGKEEYKENKKTSSNTKKILETPKKNQVAETSQDVHPSELESKIKTEGVEQKVEESMVEKETEERVIEELEKKVVKEKELEQESIEFQLASMQDILAESKDKYFRLAAEFDNYKKRQLQQVILKEQFANEAIAKDLFIAIDSLEIALDHISDKEKSNNFRDFIKGIQLVHQQLMDVLKKHHIVKMNVLGEFFDPVKHEAVATVETDDIEENKVFAVFKAGYFLHDRVIRPAVVQVSKNKQNKI